MPTSGAYVRCRRGRARRCGADDPGPTIRGDGPGRWSGADGAGPTIPGRWSGAMVRGRRQRRRPRASAWGRGKRAGPDRAGPDRTGPELKLGAYVRCLRPVPTSGSDGVGPDGAGPTIRGRRSGADDPGPTARGRRSRGDGPGPTVRGRRQRRRPRASAWGRGKRAGPDRAGPDRTGPESKLGAYVRCLRPVPTSGAVGVGPDGAGPTIRGRRSGAMLRGDGPGRWSGAMVRGRRSGAMLRGDGPGRWSGADVNAVGPGLQPGAGGSGPGRTGPDRPQAEARCLRPVPTSGAYVRCRRGRARRCGADDPGPTIRGRRSGADDPGPTIRGDGPGRWSGAMVRGDGPGPTSTP